MQLHTLLESLTIFLLEILQAILNIRIHCRYLLFIKV